MTKCENGVSMYYSSSSVRIVARLSKWQTLYTHKNDPKGKILKVFEHFSILYFEKHKIVRYKKKE